MTVSKSIQLSLFALATSCQALLAGLLPFNSVVVLPEEFVVHVESAAWVDHQGERLELFENPRSINLRAADRANISDSIVYAKEANFKPAYLEVTTRRYYEIKAEGVIQSDKKEVRAYTEEGQKAISIAGVENLSLAASKQNGTPSSQRCFFPVSDAINAKLSASGLNVEKKDFLIYRIPFQTNWLEEFDDNHNVFVQMICMGVEFGDSMTGAPYFVIPHLPYIDLIQAPQN